MWRARARLGYALKQAARSTAMVSLAGSSDAYMPLDNPIIGLRIGPPIMTINEAVVYSDDSVLGDHNILIGDKTTVDPDAQWNVILGENVKVASGVRNVVSIGVPNTRITRSNFTQIGSFLHHDGATETLELLDDAIVAEKNGSVTICGADGLVVNRAEDGAVGVEMGEFRLVERGAAGWKFVLETSENATDPSDTMRDLVLRSDNGASIVFCDEFTPAITNFTGQHRCILRGAEAATPPIGTVLVSTGEYCGLDGERVTVDEAIPVVVVSTRARDARVFGVLSSIEDAGPTRRVRVGNLAFQRPKDTLERRAVVNGSGEGGILVCAEGGDINNGDFLCTSSSAGIAMRQSQPFKCTFTCGKATTSVTFADLVDRGHDEKDVATMIGCVYA